MRTTTEILASYHDALKRRFSQVVGQKTVVPSTVDIPRDPRKALELGIKMGRRHGYGEGLVDGTEMGLDVGLGSVDEMLSQPVIFGSTGTA